MSAKNLREKLKGKFIVLDGPDGSGKSTQLERLSNYLKSEGLEIEMVADPGGTPIGDKIRDLLKYGSEDIDVATETMLFMASRAQLVAEKIKPALESGKTVLCDRYISSTCAYQAAGGYSIDKTLELGKFAVGKIWPDITIILDLPATAGRKRTGVQRSKKIKDDYGQGRFFDSPTPDMFDSRTLEYHSKVRRFFLKLEGTYPGVVKIIDVSSADIQTVTEKLKQVIIETEF